MTSMKLRVRAATGGPTIRVQIPLLCSLEGLKDVLAPMISLPSSSFSLSLNKKDEIHGPGAALVSSFGVTSGDLLYYIENSGTRPSSPFAENSTQTPVRVAGSSDRVSREVRGRAGRFAASAGSESVAQTQNRSGRAVSTPNTRRELCAAAAARRATLAAGPSLVVPDSPSIIRPATSLGISTSSTSADRVRDNSAEWAMEVDGDAKVLEVFPGHRLAHIPDLLQRVLSSESCNVRHASAYLVLAVHAVMLETGFVRVETGGSLSTLEGYELPSGWSATGFVNLAYTLPELIRCTEASIVEEIGEKVLLRCQIVGNTVVVYGAVSGGSVHRLSLSVSRFLNEKVRKFAGESSKQNESDMEDFEEPVLSEGASSSLGQASAGAHVASIVDNEDNVFRDIFELWKEVKDSLSLPLLTVMCEKAGLPPPPSLLRLPTELKIKVLDSLPSLALANISCACSELRFLAASEDIWKQKYREEFGACGERAPGGRGWKSAFVREFEHRKRREEERREAERRFRAEVFPPGIILRPPSFSPHFGGIDYFQGLGGPSRGGFGGFGPDVGGGFRSFAFRGGQPGTPTVFPGNRAAGRLDVGVGAYGDEYGICFPGIDFDGSGVRAWPPVNSSGWRGTRSLGRLDAGGSFGAGPSAEFPRRLDGGGSGVLFHGFGPS